MSCTSFLDVTDWTNQTTSPNIRYTTTINGEPAIFCPSKGGYIPSRCCPHFCQNKQEKECYPITFSYENDDGYKQRVNTSDSNLILRWKFVGKSKLGAKVEIK